MIGKNRPRWLVSVAVTASLMLALAACSPVDYPNTTFSPLSELATSIDEIWDVLLLWGLIVFVLVEAALLFIVFRFRHREGAPEPKHIHGNTKLELLWTAIPAVILVFIAVPTVRTIFITQGAAPGPSMQVIARGYQWWWEFEYPEYGIKTANELFLPAGRTVTISLETNNVLHSFWIPRLAGKRDVVNKRVNKIWFTPDDSLSNKVLNGFCAELCGTSHANMQFRVFVVSASDFESWTAHQASPAVFNTLPEGSAAAVVPQDSAAAPVPVYSFPASEVQAADYAIPKTPYARNVEFTAPLNGDAARGREIYGRSACLGCHVVNGVPASAGLVGPNLTHVGSRTTIAGAMYPNTDENLAKWIKNAPAMKPGSKMPPMGRGIIDPLSGAAVGALDDQQIADVVAYLLSLK